MDLNYFFNAANARIVIELMYAATLCYGCLSDIGTLKIPNAVPIVVLVLFLANRSLLASPDSIAPHLLAGAGAFILGFAFYAAGVMGAGDVKLISALMLWAGTRDGLQFLAAVAILGGIFAGLLLILQKSIAVWPSASGFVPLRLKSWAARGLFPYGVPICAAGLIWMPSFFS